VNIRITNIAFSPAPEPVERTGLLGWIECTVNGALRLDGLAVRRTFDGRLTLTFPAGRDARGRPRRFVRPLGEQARLAIEQQILSAIAAEVRP